MRRFVLACLPLVALAACGGHAEEETTRTETKDGVTTTTITTRAAGHGSTASAGASTGSGLSIDSDKFKANFDIPGLTFGADNMDLQGMKLYPGSTVRGMHVHAVDRPGNKQGEVVVDFTSPAAPAVVAQHMADEARRANFTLASNTAAALSGTRPGDDGIHRFAVTLTPNGGDTVGQLTMTGSETKTR